jgi:hypothetical protein
MLGIAFDVLVIVTYDVLFCFLHAMHIQPHTRRASLYSYSFAENPE